MKRENKLLILFRSVSLSLIISFKLLFSEFIFIRKRYKHDVRKRKMNLDYWEESSVWISFWKGGVQKLIYFDVLLKNKKQQKIWRERLNLPKKIFLWMSLLMPWWLFAKFLCKLVFNIISLVLYLILPKKYSSKFDKFILRKVRSIYWVLYRINWMIDQLFYINCIIIPLFIISILLEFVLLPIETLLLLIQDFEGTVLLWFGSIRYLLRYLYGFATDFATKYVWKRLFRIEEKKRFVKEFKKFDKKVIFIIIVTF